VDCVVGEQDEGVRSMCVIISTGGVSLRTMPTMCESRFKSQGRLQMDMAMQCARVMCQP
jgi:hypothetical protein